MNIEALRRVKELADKQGKDLSEFAREMHCPWCGQQGWGIERLTRCHRCDSLMVYNTILQGKRFK